MRSDRLRLVDMIESIDEVIDTTPPSLDRFRESEPVKSHVLRHLAIVGQAAFKLSKELKQSHSKVPWSQIADLRHALVRDYFRVNWDHVYQTARDQLPILKPKIESILASLPEDE